MSDRLQRISENAGRIFAALIARGDPEKMAAHSKEILPIVTAAAIDIEQEVAKQVLGAFAPSQPCTCEDVPGDHARCPIHGES